MLGRWSTSCDMTAVIMGSWLYSGEMEIELNSTLKGEGGTTENERIKTTLRRSVLEDALDLSSDSRGSFRKR